jgi:hypothetical protein
MDGVTAAHLEGVPDKFNSSLRVTQANIEPLMSWFAPVSNVHYPSPILGDWALHLGSSLKLFSTTQARSFELQRQPELGGGIGVTCTCLDLDVGLRRAK